MVLGITCSTDKWAFALCTLLYGIRCLCFKAAWIFVSTFMVGNCD